MFNELLNDHLVFRNATFFINKIEKNITITYIESDRIVEICILLISKRNQPLRSMSHANRNKFLGKK